MKVFFALLRAARLRTGLAGLGLVALVALTNSSSPPVAPGPVRGRTPQQADPRAYWHQGQAEISRFRLEQSRYGETREGDLIQVFVTEDFLPGPQVKSERGDPAERGAVHILKLNSLRRFRTGLYDYALMRSTFTPLQAGEGPQLLKLTASMQEWCGQMWLQLNRRGQEYHLEGHSYFEAEADRRTRLGVTWTEDELWTRIRTAPELLPEGELWMIPGSFDIFLQHRPLRAERARLTRRQLEGDRDQLEVSYDGIGRSLTITFEHSFPHRIEAFIERQTEGTVVFETRATRTHQILEDYWNHKGLADEGLRGRLGL